MSNKIFWRQAARAGTILGLAMVGIQLISDAVPQTASVMWWLHYIVFIGLLYGFTRNMARKADPRIGFGYARALGFVLAMMVFTGFLLGAYTFIAAKTFMYDATLQQIDTMMEIYATMPMFANQMDGMYDMVRSMMFSPVFRIISEILGYFITGLFFGLFTSAFAKINPNPFAGNQTPE